MLEINDQNCRKICKVHQHYANLLESKHQNMEKGADLNNRRREIGHQSWTGHVEDVKLCIFWVPSISLPSRQEKSVHRYLFASILCLHCPTVESNSKRLPMESNIVQPSHMVYFFLGFSTHVNSHGRPRSRDLVDWFVISIPILRQVGSFQRFQAPQFRTSPKHCRSTYLW